MNWWTRTIDPFTLVKYVWVNYTIPRLCYLKYIEISQRSITLFKICLSYLLLSLIPNRMLRWSWKNEYEPFVVLLDGSVFDGSSIRSIYLAVYVNLHATVYYFIMLFTELLNFSKSISVLCFVVLTFDCWTINMKRGL